MGSCISKRTLGENQGNLNRIGTLGNNKVPRFAFFSLIVLQCVGRLLGGSIVTE